jgi:hypothetical protein
LPQIILFFFVLVADPALFAALNFLLDRIMGGDGTCRAARSFNRNFACAIPASPIPAALPTAGPAGHHHDCATDGLFGAAAGVCPADWRVRLPLWARLTSKAWCCLRCMWRALPALAVAWVSKRFSARGQIRTVMMELPNTTCPIFAAVAHRAVAAQ